MPTTDEILTQVQESMEALDKRVEAVEGKETPENIVATLEGYKSSIADLEAKYTSGEELTAAQTKSLQDLREHVEKQVTALTAKVKIPTNGRFTHEGAMLSDLVNAAQADRIAAQDRWGYTEKLAKAVPEFTNDRAEAHFDYLRGKLHARGIQRTGFIDQLERQALADRWGLDDDAKGYLSAAVTDTSTGGVSTNLIDTVLIAELWTDVLLGSPLLARLPTMTMTAPTERVPYFEYDIYKDVTAGDDESNVNLSEHAAHGVQIQAKAFVKALRITQTLIEDSVVDQVATHRAALLRAMTLAVEDAVVNGDVATGAGAANGVVSSSTNINNVSGSAAATLARPDRQFNGLREYALRASGAQLDGNGDITTTANQNKMIELRALLKNAGVSPTGHFFVVPPALWFKLLQIGIYQTIDKIVQASVQTGVPPDIGQANVVVSEVFPEDVGSGGGIGPSANNKLSGLAVVPEMVQFGIRSPLTITVMPNQGSTGTAAAPLSTQLYARQRVGFVVRPVDTSSDSPENKAVAVIRNVDQ